MSDEKNKFTDASFENCDLKNPSDRDALKQAADKFLKAHAAEADADVKGGGEALVDPLAALQDENKELKDQLLRLAADMENLRRRTARDVADAKAYSIANFARDMLSVSDNLNRALDAIPEGAKENDAGLKTLAEGVEMTERAMIAALERHGVQKIHPEGQKFDPHFHQAMFEIPNSDVPDNTVQQVVQAGYIIGERVLRPAIVGVAKGGAKDISVESDSD
ncbi:nucleotide exchange factor GrpE [Bartonella henselae]|uniref:Protein GrpE n=1 Tax=Bartonella henselae (strain ATCC 49882 / DSM 28221 / CCUG 30454 / Houston 1) TaxID=283166 RepID=GRPE_BARHE|nr:nucleotide exchange factor GrpE [Bartonella henselae]Q6G563.1 RecName: Full=Protein GrpE; AltName: Full=HSP-70 cofactor [Bartonella henselae str. Houston-1]ATP11707.1 nucleotide exchange factor GrpE [Bartonella henselae]ETS09678.1 protein grpE [Bartonella henselae JK 42]ETS12706.1 protein grpE [Bartonella henselae JK 41]KEC58461.1 protein grpE [Bartonella henselae str. Zeus]KEC61152.1 protein grpE [Bartonella henselae JK 53]